MDNTDLMDKVVEWDCKTKPRLLDALSGLQAAQYRHASAVLTVAHLRGISLGLEMAAAVFPASSVLHDADQRAGCEPDLKTFDSLAPMGASRTLKTCPTPAPEEP